MTLSKAKQKEKADAKAKAEKEAKAKAEKEAKAKAKSGVKRDYKLRGESTPIPVKTTNEKKADIDWENPTVFEVLEDVPLPWTRVTTREIIYPFEGMGIGHSFQFMRETGRGQNVYSATVSYCRQPEHFHKRFVIRKVSEQMISGVEWTTWGCWREEDLDQSEIDKKRATIDEKQHLATKRRHARSR